MKSVNIEDARKILGDLVDRARIADEPVLIMRYNKPAASSSAPTGTAQSPANRCDRKEVPHDRCACTVRAERLRTRKQGPPEDDFPGKPLVSCGGSGI